MSITRSRLGLWGILAVSAFSTSVASAQTLFSTDFESDTIGTTPAGWTFADFYPDRNASGSYVSANPLSSGIDTSSQVMYVTGPDGDSAIFTNGIDLTPYTSDGVSGSTITLSFNYLATAPANAGLIMGLTSYTPDEGTPGGYDGAGGDYYIVAPNQDGQIGDDLYVLPSASGWQSVSVTLSGAILSNFVATHGSLSNVSVYMEQWQNNDTFGQVYLDNVTITAVPELPVTAIVCGLAALGAVGFASYRRRVVAV